MQLAEAILDEERAPVSLVSSVCVVTSVIFACPSCFPCLFLPPIPADTSAKTLSGSPFSFPPSLEPASSSEAGPSPPLLPPPPAFFGVIVFGVLLDGVSSESAEAETASRTPLVIGVCPIAVAGAGGLKSLRWGDEGVTLALSSSPPCCSPPYGRLEGVRYWCCAGCGRCP